MTLIVCAASERDALVAEARPRHLITIASPGHSAPIGPPDVAHLHLAFHDGAADAEGLVPPSGADVVRLLAFGRGWAGDGPLLVSCEFGVSRSPAAAFALACQRLADVAPEEIAGRLRARSPQATPNPRVVALADALLGRRGSMVAAVRAIGRGRDYTGPAAFTLPLEPVFAGKAPTR